MLKDLNYISLHIYCTNILPYEICEIYTNYLKAGTCVSIMKTNLISVSYFNWKPTLTFLISSQFSKIIFPRLDELFSSCIYLGN